MMRLEVVSLMKGLLNYVKGFRLYSSGSQDSGKGIKQVKFHYSGDKECGALTEK